MLIKGLDLEMRHVIVNKMQPRDKCTYSGIDMKNNFSSIVLQCRNSTRACITWTKSNSEHIFFLSTIAGAVMREENNFIRKYSKYGTSIWPNNENSRLSIRIKLRNKKKISKKIECMQKMGVAMKQDGLEAIADKADRMLPSRTKSLAFCCGLEAFSVHCVLERHLQQPITEVQFQWLFEPFTPTCRH